MNNIRIRKKELLKIVKDNYKKHSSEYNIIITNYKDYVVKLAKTNLDLAKSGDLNLIAQMKAIPSVPTFHGDCYMRVVRMLELSVDNDGIFNLDVNLNEQEFSELVMDEWDWKKEFNSTFKTYKDL